MAPLLKFMQTIKDNGKGRNDLTVSCTSASRGRGERGAGISMMNLLLYMLLNLPFFHAFFTGLWVKKRLLRS